MLVSNVSAARSARLSARSSRALLSALLVLYRARFPFLARTLAAAAALSVTRRFWTQYSRGSEVGAGDGAKVGTEDGAEAGVGKVGAGAGAGAGPWFPCCRRHWRHQLVAIASLQAVE